MSTDVILILGMLIVGLPIMIIGCIYRLGVNIK
jgi:hypothetical protein